MSQFRLISWSWIKWRRKKKRKRPPTLRSSFASSSLASSEKPPSIAPSDDVIINSNDTEDEFLQYFRQYRPDKNALPEGWVTTIPPGLSVSPTTFRDDSLSRDSGRSSYGEVTDDSPLLAETSARNLLPSRPWFDKQHFFNRPVDEISDYSYCSPKEDEDSGVSSITTFDFRNHNRRHHQEDLPDLWDAASAHSVVLPLKPQEMNGSTNGFELVQILKWWLGLLICLLMAIVFSGSFWFNQIPCQQSGEAFDVATLAQTMNATVFGQDLAVHLMMSLVTNFNHEASSHVTVALLFGNVGTGKSHVANLVNKAFLYPKNVFRLSSSHSLDLEDIEARWSNCGPSLLIVEDIEELQSDKMETIAQIAIKKHKRLLILVTTKIGGINLNTNTLEWMKTGNRKDITVTMITKMLDKERVLMPSIQTVSTNLIPFLPLNRKHVIQCIWKEVMAQGGSRNILLTSDQVQWILNQTEFFSKSFPLFARDGCKRVAENVGLVINAKDLFLGMA